MMQFLKFPEFDQLSSANRAEHKGTSQEKQYSITNVTESCVWSAITMSLQ